MKKLIFACLMLACVAFTPLVQADPPDTGAGYCSGVYNEDPDCMNMCYLMCLMGANHNICYLDCIRVNNCFTHCY